MADDVMEPRDWASFGQPFSMAFQPIVNVRKGHIFAQEALVRGMGGESAASVLCTVTEHNRYALDQTARICAINPAHRLHILDGDALLSINVMSSAIRAPASGPHLRRRSGRASPRHASSSNSPRDRKA